MNEGVTVRSWSTGEYREWVFDTLKQATHDMRYKASFKPSYFDQVFYVQRHGKRHSHKYTVPAGFTFEEFKANIGAHVKLTLIA